MALIKCPECGKEISDKSITCPQCGYPLNESREQKEVQDSPKKSSFPRKRAIVFGAIALLVIIAVVVVYLTIIKPNSIFNEAQDLVADGEYEEAQELIDGIPGRSGVEELQNEISYKRALVLLDEGNYEEAKNVLDTISEYEGKTELLEQIKYETWAFDCIKQFKPVLKNPDSFQLYEVVFYGNGENEILEGEDPHPVCITHYGAQNGFGGNTTGYFLSMYNVEEGTGYELLGTCDTLDIDEIDEDDLADQLTCIMINTFAEDGSECGSVDINRMKTLLKNEAYSTIKIIE